jgi:hypothetical protein
VTSKGLSQLFFRFTAFCVDLSLCATHAIRQRRRSALGFRSTIEEQVA